MRGRFFQFTNFQGAAIAGATTAFFSIGLDAGLKRPSIVEKAVNHPEALTEKEKAELQKLLYLDSVGGTRD